MKKVYKTLKFEFIEFKTDNVIMSSVVLGDGDNSITDDFEDLA